MASTTREAPTSPSSSKRWERVDSVGGGVRAAWPVVDPNHRNVGRHPDAVLGEGTDDPQRDQVVDGEHRIRDAFVEHACGRVVAALACHRNRLGNDRGEASSGHLPGPCCDPGLDLSIEFHHSQARLDALRHAVEDGALTAGVADILPAEDASDAHRRLEAGGTRGRIVLAF